MKPPRSKGPVSQEALDRIRDRGLAPRNLIIEAGPGAIFRVDDEAIKFPDEKIVGAGARTTHSSRPAIVINSVSGARRATPKSIMVVPCSASQKGLLGPWAYEIPNDEPRFTAQRVVVLAHLLQPILKSELQQFLGRLRPETYLALQAVIALNLGFVEEESVLKPAIQGLQSGKPSSTQGTSEG